MKNHSITLTVLNLGFTQLLMTLELELYHTPSLAAHHNRFPQNQVQIQQYTPLSPTISSASSHSKYTQGC